MNLQPFRELDKHVQIAIVIAVLIVFIMAALNHSALENIESLVLLILTILGFKKSSSSQE
jgi:hypothetical protein